MNLEKIMTKELITMDIDNSIYEISKKMKKHDIGFIPISKDNKIIGVITDRDIVISALSNNTDPDTKIENYMTHYVINLDVDKTIEDAIDLMGKEQVKRLLITKKNKVVGILSLSDIINAGIDDKKLVENLKKIWSITHKNDKTKPEIDEFYL